MTVTATNVLKVFCLVTVRKNVLVGKKDVLYETSFVDG